MFTSLILSLPILCLAFAAPAAEKTVDPSGSWRLVDESGVPGVLRLDLGEDGKVTGTYHRQGNEVVPIKKGRIDGATLSLEVDVEIQGSQMHSRLTAKVDGDKLEGHSDYSGGLGSGVSGLSAKRSVLSEDMVGEWKISFTTQEGDAAATLRIEVEGKELKCKYITDAGKTLPVLRLQLKANVMSFNIETMRDGDTVKVTFRGRAYGSNFNGNFAYEFQGNTGEIPFKGKRVAEKDRRS
jgi:hypothetical protein